MVEFLLPDSEVIEQPPCTDSLTGRGHDNPEVLAYAYIIPYASVVEPAYPFLSHELAVGDKEAYAVLSEKADEAFHELPPLLPIGIAPFRKKTENKRKCKAFIGYTLHKDIDIEFSELPVGGVYAEHKTVLYRKQRKNHSGYDVKVNNVLGEESLKSAEVGVLVLQ